MFPGPHYYVLSLSIEVTLLFEAFRDSLIELENQGFPVLAALPASPPPGDGQLQEWGRTIDASFANHHTPDPLNLVVVGERQLRAAFASVTAHGAEIIGEVEGEHTATTTRDLGQIVWPLVKEAMSGVVENAMRDLEALAGRDQVVSGLEAVARHVNRGIPVTLLVEDDYHVRGGLTGTRESPVVSPEVDLRDALDDAVDAIIQKVLESGGNVVFTSSGSLRDRERIVSFPRGVEGVRGS